jgi:hypothetical protein
MTYYTLCGCWYPVPAPYGGAQRQYLPQVQLESHTTILSTTSRTTLKQVFTNTRPDQIAEVQYTFPLYDGVSVAGFKCTVGAKVLTGVVKEKQTARKDYQEAIARGETASLLEQVPEAADCFTTKVGNVPTGEKILIEIIYLGELKHDAETDGSRFTIPTTIAPRYGQITSDSSASNITNDGGIKILVDVALDSNSIIRGLQSPSHPIAVTMGRTSSMDEEVFDNTHASATLTLGKAELDKDFVIVIQSKEQGIPQVLLETHPTIENQRALMATLVPKFNLPNITTEIVFIVDRSGSMHGKIDTLVTALKVFLKSLPANGTKFNICSFGSRYSFLFKKSKTYDETSLKEALAHLNTFGADFGGTEMLDPVKATCKNRYNDLPLEVMVLTDGQIWNQEAMFKFINEQKNARFFSLGIGDGASSALVEGIARAGGGFAQFVGDNEKMDKRIVRMLKAALTPHINDYRLEVHYDNDDNEFEVVESSLDSMETVAEALPKSPSIGKKVISLFDTSAKEEPTNPKDADRFSGLPTLTVPKILQAPNHIPALYPFNRTTVYLLLSPEASQKIPKSVKLCGTSEHGPLELEIPLQDVGRAETLHQLATKKAVHELEDGRGWITDLKIDNKPLKSKYEGRWDLMVERECVRLGVQYQVAGKYCSFVAVETKDENAMDEDKDGEEFEVVQKEPTYPGGGVSHLQTRPQAQMFASAPLTISKQTPSSSVRYRMAAAPPRPGAAPRGGFGGAAFGGAVPRNNFAAASMAYAPMATQHAHFAQSHLGGPVAQATALPSGTISADTAMFEPEFARSAPEMKKKSAAAPRKQLASRAARMSVPAMAARESVARDEDAENAVEDGYAMDMDIDMDKAADATESLKQISNDDKMHKLIEMKEFNGSWKSSDALYALISVDKDVVKAMGQENAMSTALAVAWLEVKMSSEEDVWEMVVAKAKDWLRALVGAAEAEKAITQAKGLLAA